MTIDEAIKILEPIDWDYRWRSRPEVGQAIKLGEEALRYVKTSRDPDGVPPYIPLKGET